MPSIIFIVFAAHEVARKFSKGLGGQNTKFGTIKGPIQRIGIFLHLEPRFDPSRIAGQMALESLMVPVVGLILIAVLRNQKGQKVLKNDGNDINDDAIYGALKDRLHLKRHFSH